MLFSKVIVVAGLFAASEALALRGLERDLIPSRSQLLPSRVLRRQNGNKCLKDNAVQTGSQNDGQDPPVAGQTASATDNENFINFCSGKTVTNGLQVQAGSCNGIVMGEIPSNDNMISAIIISPKPGEAIEADKTFTLSVQVKGLQAGAFTNAQKTYYGAPQTLNNQGQIIGHTHVTVQDLGGNLEPSQPPDPKTFVFFKGINDNGNGNGLLSADVAGGLPAGNYRVCSMTSASNHQPVLMPVAQRGAQDDCQKFTVGGGGGGNNNNNNAGNNNNNNNAGNNNNNNAGNNNGNNNAGNNNGGNNNAVNNNGGNNGGNNNGGNNNGGNNGGNNNAANNGGNNNGGNKANAAAVGGIAAPAITDSGDAKRPFTVNGNTFTDRKSAVQRSCDVQRNSCLDAVNRGQANGVARDDCEKQATTCNAAA